MDPAWTSYTTDLRALVKAGRDHRAACDAARPRRANPAIALDETANIYLESSEVKKGIPDFLRLEGRDAATARTEILDDMGSVVRKYLSKYPSGLDREVVTWRQENRARILKYMGGTEDDWNDHVWQLNHVIRDAAPLLDLIELLLLMICELPRC